MIGTIDIKVTAANPNIPLKTLFAFVNSPSSIRIIDVPKKIGNWRITDVYVNINYPDNSIHSIKTVQTGGCYVGTIPASSSVGKSLNGLTIVANGIDENNQPVSGYVLGKSDVVILDTDGRTIIDGKIYYLHLFEGDNIPENPNEGDVIYVDDGWKIYHNDEWMNFGGKSLVWGNIEGEITNQQDLDDALNSKLDNTGLTNDNGNLTIDGSLTVENIDIVESLSEKASANDVNTIKSKIPNAASTENQLADKDFVNSSINNFAAFYITKDSAGNAFATKSELTNATVYYSGGQVRVPTKNDYCIVLEDESKITALGVNPTTRYTYNAQWEFQYIVNNTSLTQAQVNAINSGITKDIVDNRVIPSSTTTGWAANAENAHMAQNCNAANYAETANRADSATYANEADFAETASSATTATYAPNYTPLSTFNETLGNLSAIIRDI